MEMLFSQFSSKFECGSMLFVWLCANTIKRRYLSKLFTGHRHAGKKETLVKKHNLFTDVYWVQAWKVPELGTHDVAKTAWQAFKLRPQQVSKWESRLILYDAIGASDCSWWGRMCSPSWGLLNCKDGSPNLLFHDFDYVWIHIIPWGVFNIEWSKCFVTSCPNLNPRYWYPILSKHSCDIWEKSHSVLSADLKPQSLHMYQKELMNLRFS